MGELQMSSKRFAHMPPPTLTDPHADARTKHFWDAAKEHRLTAPRCASCKQFRMPPTTFCPSCMSRDLEWPELSGLGTLYTFIVIRHPLNPTASDYVPFVPAVVEPDGAPGIRFVSDVVECDPDDVEIGMRLRVVWHEVNDALTLPFWAPA